MTSLTAIGSSAVATYRSALAATAQNVANAGTASYVRRSARVEEIAPAGNGAAVARIDRQWDRLLADDWRATISDAGAADTQSGWAARIETALQIQPIGQPDSLSNFFAAATRLSANPRDTAARALFTQSLDTVATDFRAMGEGLTSLVGDLDATLGATADRTNNLLADLAGINRALTDVRSGSEGQAQLLDRRDAALASLAEHLAIDVAFADDGQVEVRTLDGFALLGAHGPARLAMAADGSTALMATHDGGTASIEAGGGTLGGVLATRDGLADTRQRLDSMAARFAETLNGWSATGVDSTGLPGGPLLSGSTAATLALIERNPARIAAASVDGRANGNLLALDSIRASTAIESELDALRSDAAIRPSALRQSSERLTGRRDSAALALDALTGVDLDREAADLLRLQQAYGASARILQVASDTLDTVLGLR